MAIVIIAIATRSLIFFKKQTRIINIAVVRLNVSFDHITNQEKQPLFQCLVDEKKENGKKIPTNTTKTIGFCIKKNQSLIHQIYTLILIASNSNQQLFQAAVWPKLLPFFNFFLLPQFSDSTIKSIHLIPNFSMALPVDLRLPPPRSPGVLLELQHHRIYEHHINIVFIPTFSPCFLGISIKFVNSNKNFKGTVFPLHLLSCCKTTLLSTQTQGPHFHNSTPT